MAITKHTRFIKFSLFPDALRERFKVCGYHWKNIDTADLNARLELNLHIGILTTSLPLNDYFNERLNYDKPRT